VTGNGQFLNCRLELCRILDTGFRERPFSAIEYIRLAAAMIRVFVTRSTYIAGECCHAYWPSNDIALESSQSLIERKTMTAELYQGFVVVAASGMLTFAAGLGVRLFKETLQYRRDVQDGKVEKVCPQCQRNLYERRLP
jgi:hypothetical protein